MKYVVMSAILWLLCIGLSGQTDYVIRSLDTLQITVWNQSDLRTKYTVEPDGNITFPFVGRIKAAGLTQLELAAELRKRLADGFFRDPQVTVTVDQPSTGRIFVFGSVTAPGAYPLTSHMTLLEALARAGYGNASEAVIVRTKGASGPVLPEENTSSETIKVNLREFERDVQNGSLARNVILMDGDTVFVPRTDPNRIFITGEVRAPGAYSVPEGTTVLQALTLAGGVTENASLGRARIIRLVDGKRQTIRAEPNVIVKPGDTITVPERFF